MDSADEDGGADECEAPRAQRGRRLTEVGGGGTGLLKCDFNGEIGSADRDGISLPKCF